MADNRTTLHVEREDGERFKAGAKEAGVTAREWFGLVLDDLERLSKLEASQTTAAMKRLDDELASTRAQLSAAKEARRLAEGQAASWKKAAIRGMMVRLGLYSEFQTAVYADRKEN